MYIISRKEQLLSIFEHGCYVYGAGKVAQAFLALLDLDTRANIQGVFVSDKPKNDIFFGIELMQFNKDKLSKDDFVLVLLSNPLKEVISVKLMEIGHDNFAVLTDELCHRQLKQELQDCYIYDIDGFQLELGKGHTLPEIQKRFPMYDAFIPYLGALSDKIMSPNGGWIVDVGANVGDTTAAMLRHTQASVLCVEPTDHFFSLLQRNVVAFGSPFSERVRLTKAFVSLNTGDKFVSKVERGTAVNVITSGQSEAEAYTLPDLLMHEGIELSQVVLIKTDTDGYDADCILSIDSELKKAQPLLYWENQLDNMAQYRKYVELAHCLENDGYNDFFVFDNFGNFLTHTNADGLIDIDNYLLRIQQNHSARTFYYVDVLGCKPLHVQLCSNIVYEYLNTWK